MFEDSRISIFMAVAREGSFTRAAKAIGISQPAVSQNIAEIEKAVGAQLFERRRGEVVLTNKGKRFQEFASQINYWYKAASEELRSDIPAPVKSILNQKKDLRIGVGEGYRCFLMPAGADDLDIEVDDISGNTSVRIVQKKAEPEGPAGKLF